MIKVLFFASLRERTGQNSLQLDWQEGLTTAQLWQQTTNDTQMPENVLVARNQEYCDAGTPVQDGDEIAFFPPVTGG
ncbi:MAG: molybdopterin converting factor subunit 1 [Thiolinea sp.]